MPFKSTIRIPSEVLDAIVSLTELTTAFAIQSTTDAGRADEHGGPQRPARGGSGVNGIRWA